MARRLRADCACSKARCNLLFRFAAVKWVRRSKLSADGLTVAALAVHIGEAEYAHARITGASLAALASTSASLPLKPMLRSMRKLGRSCGGNSACAKPRAASARILANPCKAASLGLDALLTLLNEATLPNDRPA